MKLIIDIPEDLYNDMIKWVKVDGNFCSLVDEAIANATPLEKHDEEIIKETVESIWGKTSCDDAISRKAVLEQIKANYLASEDIISLANGLEDSVKALPSVYPQNTEVLDSIKAEIEQYKADCDLSCSDNSNCRTCNNITFGSIYRIIDKYRKGDKE